MAHWRSAAEIHVLLLRLLHGGRASVTACEIAAPPAPATPSLLAAGRCCLSRGEAHSAVSRGLRRLPTTSTTGGGVSAIVDRTPFATASFFGFFFSRLGGAPCGMAGHPPQVGLSCLRFS